MAAIARRLRIDRARRGVEVGERLGPAGLDDDAQEEGGGVR